MKVKIGNTTYDAEDQPIMVILNKGEQGQIANMAPGCTKYAQFPDELDWSVEKKCAWMDDNLEPFKGVPFASFATEIRTGFDLNHTIFSKQAIDDMVKQLNEGKLVFRCAGAAESENGVICHFDLHSVNIVPAEAGDE